MVLAAFCELLRSQAANAGPIIWRAIAFGTALNEVVTNVLFVAEFFRSGAGGCASLSIGSKEKLPLDD